ncbi:rhomboid family intramembrane serine protease [Sediminibacter sp. Hel_I_10]|uniref:rhomboid family intramembrane serine protease n=1 Tax=Sediminibacter sp. Hel_I_10 TaxID=1392490 RepID=UPI00047D81E3|nr:rhomboid family intramembrane serine protease [Sediminibacter sp. Hel_I_10]
MASLSNDISNKLRNLNVLEKIIAINVLIFLIGLILGTLQGLPRGYSLRWLELPKDFFDFLLRPWSILTYGFTHYDFMHILFNMLVLYFVSRSLLNLFSAKQTLNIYFLGIISGGFVYLLVYNVLPSSMHASVGSLVGASAGVNALLIFLCTYLPNNEVRFFTINIKLWYIGVAIVVFDVIGLFGVNQGGKLAHLGGSLLGYLYATQLQKGIDIGSGFAKLTDSISNWFKPKSKLKTVHRNQSKGYAGYNKKEFNELNKQKKIDAILDKISKSGYESLTKDEKAILFQAGKD